MRRWSLLMLAAVVVAVTGVNCPGPDDSSKPREAALRAFSSADELRSFLAGQAAAPYRQQNGGRHGGLLGLFLAGAAPAMSDLAAAPTAGGAEDSGGQNYSTTNVQEEGVDESDIVKNDGNYIYMLTGSRIHVVKANPVNEMDEVAVIEVDATGDSLYLRGNELVALSSTGYYFAYDGIALLGQGGAGVASGAAGVDAGVAVTAKMPGAIGGPWFDGNQAAVTVIDVTDPANPAISKTIRFEGTLASSRLIGGKLHLVLSTLPKLPDNPTPESIEAMTIEDWLPAVQVVSSGGEVEDGTAVSWEGCLRPADPNGYAMTVVATIDLDNLDAPVASTAVTANVGTIYASTEALYLTDTQYSYEDYIAHTDTIIHKLAFTDAGTDYLASGLVPGRPLSQYSLGEYQDYLRIATTNEQFTFNRADVSSGLYVLGADGSELKTVGKIENIAPGERIYAARFIGERGFLVTFRQVDPLFTMDLSDPANPRIVGELHIPGYSSHIQLLDENHLLTIGRNAEEDGPFAWVQGLLLTIFDITDMANPQILKIGDVEARVEIGGRGTYSEAEYNPKAFNFYPSRGALALPVDLYDGNTTGAVFGTHAFTGLYVYRVTVAGGFEFLGRIASADGLSQNNCFQGYYGATRGVFIEDVVYSVTDAGVKAASLDDVGTIVGQTDFSGTGSLVTDCFWLAETPVLELPPSEDLR